MIGGFILYGAVGLFSVIAIIMLVIVTRAHQKLRRAELLKKKLLLIRVPQITKADPQKPFTEEINQTEQLLATLASHKEGAVFETAVHHVGGEIHFYVSVPQEQVSFISRQIEGLFKDAHIEEAPEYNVYQPDGVHAQFYLKQDTHFALPIRTYIESQTDTFSPIVSGLSKINEIGEGVALQILIKPAPDSYKKRIIAIMNDIRKGESFEKIASKHAIKAKDLYSMVNIASKEKEQQKEESIVDQEALRALEKKIERPLVLVNYRIVVSTASQYQTDAIADSITSSFSQFQAPLRNKLNILPAKNLKKFAFQFAFREFDDNQIMVLNTQEVAGLFHLPSSSTLSPKIKWLKAKEAPPPANLPQQGTLIGESIFRGDRKPVHIAEDDRRRHMYIVGQTGTGKSTLMVNMAIEDIRSGKGVAVVDPHGDLVETILGLVPQDRQQDVIVLDPSQTQRPVGLNMLEHDPNRPEEKTFIVNEIQGIFNRLFLAETMGPMFEQYMRNALLLLMEDRDDPASLMEVSRIFTDDEFRNRKIEKATNPVVVDFWTKEAIKVGGEASLANMTPYITSKFNNFVANDYIRPIIGQTHSAFNFRNVMDEGKILLVNLSKGRIGDLNANLLGMIITGKFLMAALSRVDVPQEQRKDFNLYIDEFQNFTTDSISVILSEARKYRLNLTIAHQFIAQLEEKIRDSVFGNVGSMLSFRVGPQDAEFLEKQFEPVFSQNDLMNIDNFNAYAKILINNQTSKPFNIRTIKHSQPDPHLIHELKEQSSLRYGKDRIAVEQEILQRLRT